jgi:hypothetical protein
MRSASLEIRLNADSKLHLTKKQLSAFPKMRLYILLNENLSYNI